MSTPTSGWLLPAGDPDSVTLTVAPTVGRWADQPDMRPAYVGEMVHLARPDGSCWSALVTQLHDDPERDPVYGRHVGLTVFRPPAFARNNLITEAVDRTAFDGHGMPGTWHHMDTRPVHRSH